MNESTTFFFSFSSKQNFLMEVTKKIKLPYKQKYIGAKSYKYIVNDVDATKSSS